ncbi:Polysaccharide biosynthesis protein C-terminal domain-containing protein [Methylorubrum aminovorans]
MSAGSRRGAFVAALGIGARAITQVVTVAITIAAAKSLDPASFGIFSLAAILTVLGRTLLYVGAYEYLMKSDEPDRYVASGLVVNVSAAVFFGALLTGVGWAAAPYLGGDAFLGLLAMLMPSNVLAAFSAWQEAMILRSGKLPRYYLVTILAEVAAGAITIVLIERGLGLTALVIQLYLRAILLSVGFLLVDRPALCNAPSVASLRTIMGWSRSRYGAVFTNYLSNYAADFIIGALLSPSATGLYRTGSRIVTAASDLFAQPANLISRAAFSRLFREGKRPEEVWPDALFVFGILAFPALAGLAILSGEIVSLVLGPTWQGAAQVIATLCVARGAGLIPAILGPLFIVRDRQRTVLAVQTFAALATVLGLLWSSRHGLLYAAATVATVQAVIAAVMVAWLARLNGLDIARLARIAGILAGVSAFVAATAKATLLILTTDGPISIAAAIAAGSLAWGCVAFAMRRHLVRSLHGLR